MKASPRLLSLLFFAAGLLFPGARLAGADAGAELFSQVVSLPSSPLSPREKAAHVLGRLAFGPRPGEVEALARGGDAALSLWMVRQLFPETISVKSDGASERFTGLSDGAKELRQRYPQVNELAKQMGIDPAAFSNDEELRRRVGKDRLPQRILEQLTERKLVRAVESDRQLEEVLADFWFNHFNVDFEKDRVRWLLPDYEKDTIRPHLFGRFRDLLGAVAHSPAMLVYLDNALSVKDGFVPKRSREARGLNENYGRELLELHTLGVEGGYTQTDVREVARALTGWSVAGPEKGFHFIFRDEAHDEAEKVVLGIKIPAGGGMMDGERVLDIVASHPATARFIATKLCRRFVADEPSASLVNRVASAFQASGGDLRWVYVALFSSPEFWSRAAYRGKVKTPFEYVVSSLRAVGGHLSASRQLAHRLKEMGEELYHCVPPTGYKDFAAPWVNAGALVSRLNFSLALTSRKVEGVAVEELASSNDTKRALGSPDFQRK